MIYSYFLQNDNEKVEIAIDDPFWQTNSNLPFQEVAKRVSEITNQLKKQLNEFNIKTGLKLNEDQLLTFVHFHVLYNLFLCVVKRVKKMLS